MADETINIPLLIDTADAAKSVKETTKAIKDLKSAALQVGEGNAGFSELVAKAGELKDGLNDVNQTVSVLSGNIAENLAGGFSKLATAGIGAFQAVAGAQALFGNENKDLQKTFIKLQALMSLSQGIKSFGDIGQAAKDFKIVITDVIAKILTKTTVTAADAAATEGATAAQIGLNAAMLANPIILLLAGIAALVAAFVIFGNTSEEAIKRQSELNQKQAESKNVLLDLIDSYRILNIEVDKNNGIISEEQAAKLKNTIEGQGKLRALQAEYSKKNQEILKQDGLSEQELQRELNANNLEFERKAIAARDELYAKNDVDESAAGLKKREKDKAAADKAASEAKARIKALNDFIKQAAEDGYKLDSKQTLEQAKEQRKRLEQFKDISGKKAALEDEYNTNSLAADAKTAQTASDADVEQAKKTIEEDKALKDYLSKADEDQNAEALARKKELNEEVKQLTFNLINEFASAVSAIGGNYGNFAGSLVTSFGSAFQTITDAGASTAEKVQGSLNAIADAIGAINQLQQAQAQQQLSNISASYNEQYAALATTRDLELNKEGLTAKQKIAIQNAAALAEYRLKLKQYNEETKIKKAAFEQSQKLQIAQTIISGASAALQAFQSAQVLPFPASLIVGGVLAAGVAVLTAVQVNAIKKQKFDAGTPPPAPNLSVSTAGIDAASQSTGGSTAPTKMNDFSLFGTAGRKNNIGAGGKDGDRSINVNVNVGVDEITKTQNKVEKFKEDSTLGG